MQRWLVPLFLMTPLAGLSADREILELQRDVAQLDDIVRTLQRTLDERTGAMLAFLQQILDRANKEHVVNATRDNSLQDRLNRQEQNLMKPVAALEGKLNKMTSEVSASRFDMADLQTRMRSLDEKLEEFDRVIRTIPVPAPPPPAITSTPGGPPAGVTADKLLETARTSEYPGSCERRKEKRNGDLQTASGVDRICGLGGAGQGGKK